MRRSAGDIASVFVGAGMHHPVLLACPVCGVIGMPGMRAVLWLLRVFKQHAQPAYRHRTAALHVDASCGGLRGLF
jgi:hypothetical protein